MKCNGCGSFINKDHQTYWIIYSTKAFCGVVVEQVEKIAGKPEKIFCGIDCYQKHIQQEFQKKQVKPS